MPKISISLPSLRPELLSETIRAVHASAGRDDYEILVVSPFEVSGPRIRWLPETERRGNCGAHALAYEQAAGDIIVALTDYVWPRGNWLNNLVNFIETMESGVFPFCAGQFRANSTSAGPSLGSQFGRYYPYYPAATRRSLEAVGGWFSREFMAGYGDSDLALRVWDAGGQCRPCWDSVILTSCRRRFITGAQRGLKDRTGEDRVVFENKWGARLGAGWRLGEGYNYNIDIPVSLIPFDDMTRLPALAGLIRDGLFDRTVVPS
jgi:hypothetical protein